MSKASFSAARSRSIWTRSRASTSISRCLGACSTMAPSLCAALGRHSSPFATSTVRSISAIRSWQTDARSGLQFGAEPTRRIGPENPHLASEEGELLHGKLDGALFRVAFDVGVEHRGVERAFELIGFKLRHVDAIGGKAAERLVKRRGHVPHAEDKCGDDRTITGFGVIRLHAKHDEARGVVLRVLDIRLDDAETINLGGQRRCDRRAATILQLAQMPRSAGGISFGDGLQLQRLDDFAAMADGHGMAVHRLQLTEFGAGKRQELLPDALEMLADDIELRIRQKMMDVGNAAGDRILDWDHGELRRTSLHRGKRVL